MLARSPRPTSPAIAATSFDDRQALAGQRRLGRLQRGGLDDPRVGRDRVAFLDEDDVAGHEIGGRHARRFTVANHVRVRGRHLSQRRNRGFGSLLLDVAHEPRSAARRR